MQRRRFLKQGFVASAATLLAPAAMAGESKDNAPAAFAEKPFNLNYAFHDGMFKHHAGADFIDQIKFAHSLGFRSIEDNGMMGRSPEQQQKIGDTLAKLGMQMGVFVVTTDNWHWKTTLATG